MIGVVLVLAAVIIGFLLLGDDDGEQTAVAEGLGDTEAATQDQADEGAVEGSQGADAEAEQADDAAADDAEAAQTDTDQAAVDAEGEDETTEDAPGVPAPAAQGRLAFVADGDIWLSATDGQGAVNVTEGAHPGAAQPAWRPGTGEVVVSTEAGLVLLDPAGGDAQQLTSGAGDTDPAWDPDGAQIVFSIPAGEGVRDLAVLEPGGDPRPLGLPESMAGQVGAVVTQRPTWSPDGTAITFHNAADDLTLWSVDPSGSEPALVQGVSGDAAFHPAYTPDGNLVYSGGQEGARVVYLLDFASATSRVIAAADGTDAKDADPSPCGNWVVYQVDAEDGSSIAISPIAAEDDAAATEAQQVPLPEGLASASDPAWSGQRCPA